MRRIYILNFNNSRDLADIKFYFDNGGSTNINIILEDFPTGKTNWSVPKNAVPGDIVIFMCAKEARHNLGSATAHIPSNYSKKFRDFVEEQKALYKQYSGHMLGCGVIDSIPEVDEDGRYYADISELRKFANPIYIDDFRSFISVSKASSITNLKEEQWERLKWVVNQKNPGFFKNAVSPSTEDLQKEFDDAVAKESKKSLEELRKIAEKNKSVPNTSSVNTQVYQRNPAIAAYVKKRANGVCQLCGQKAPFTDKNGDPYLECHHLVWLSKGGMDSADNCVALCPNCHRRMHILNDPEDVTKIRSKLS